MRQVTVNRCEQFKLFPTTRLNARARGELTKRTQTVHPVHKPRPKARGFPYHVVRAALAGLLDATQEPATATEGVPHACTSDSKFWKSRTWRSLR
jgi:hypothetical protein